MMAKTQVDYSRALKKIRAARKDIQKQGELTIKDLLREGLLKAKASAPFDTGLTAKSVRTIQKRRADGSEGLIIAPNAHKAKIEGRIKGHYKLKGHFNLTRWMHNPKNFGHFRKARPDFMNLTAEYLRRIKKTTANNRMQKIKLKYGQ